ncbi:MULTISPECIES: MotA/TolQ/ExbB proton channel family protein [unclassified Methanobrevibacter]|mgnify:FL=1|jgi:biopolymer transport protein ExbB/TolQ|uniref:MotA/TolQ/ExbB proton channel family protein n=1 Tax=unclassified Methanobrevibacter TaxID=2638681 RepID=UPI0039B82637
MVSSIPGSSFLTSALDVISQSLQIPVIVFLLLFAIISIIILGGLISEYTSRKKVSMKTMRELIYNITESDSVESMKEVIASSNIPKSQRRVLDKIASSSSLTKDSRVALARKFIENEEDRTAKSLEKTDIITRIGPTLGLMGTLIPMGPGLAALGTGDVNTLSQAIIVAFDTTVVGIGAGAIAYFVSKVRSHWYEEYLSNLDALADVVLDKLNHLKSYGK